MVRRQLDQSLPDAATAANTVVAYEPVWAIGTGLTATAATLRECMPRSGRPRERFAAEGANMRILYGGSVKPSNARELWPLRMSMARSWGAPASRPPTFWVSSLPMELDGSPWSGNHGN